jgi:membrane protease YdiL (CAAX protease family)
MITTMKNNPLVWFFVFAFAFSWIPGFPAVIFPGKYGGLAFFSAFGPALAALLVGGMTEGADGIKKLLQSLFQWRVKWIWYLIVLFGPTLTMAVAILLYTVWNRSFSLQGIAGALSQFPQHVTALVLFFLFIFAGIWGEEIGWRGFALPRLQGQYHPVLASLLLGAIWAVWHLPLFFTEGSVHIQMGFPFFFFATLGYSILYSWIFNGTKESVFMMCMLHAANNATVTYSMIFFKPLITEPVFALSVLALFDVLVILLTRSTLLYQKKV